MLLRPLRYIIQELSGCESSARLSERFRHDRAVHLRLDCAVGKEAERFLTLSGVSNQPPLSRCFRLRRVFTGRASASPLSAFAGCVCFGDYADGFGEFSCRNFRAANGL